MNHLGIDPGLHGALALLRARPDDASPAYEVTDMPVLDHQVDGHALTDLLYDTPIDTHIWVEYSQAFPRQGLSSTFTTGVGYGIILGVLASLGLRYTTVRPAAWKRHLGLAGKDKEASRARAKQLFPAAPLHRKKDEGRAEALLLAWYGQQQMRSATPLPAPQGAP